MPKTHGDEHGRRREWRTVGQHDSTVRKRLNLHDDCKYSAILSSLVAEKAKPANLYDDTMAHLEIVKNFPGPPQRRYDLYANTYNPGWRDHPNLSYGVNPQYNQPYQNQQTLNFQREMKDFQQKTEASIRELTISTERLNSQGKLPSQTESNLRQYANAVTLRNGKVRVKPPLPKIQPPFPGRLNQYRKSKEDKEILETFRNVEINLPLLDAIRQIPRYAKFLKELCTNKQKLTGNEKVSVGENVSAVLQRKMPAKCKDRGMFAIPCKIGHLGIKKAMCDLEAFINVMPFSIYESLNAGFLTKTGVIIQLADRSIVHSEGVLEDVLVKVNRLIFPADFYVIKIKDDNAPGSSDILLGRPFLSTANTKIDVRNETLTMEFDGEIVEFNVYGTISHPNEILDVNCVDIIDSSVEKTFESSYGDKSKMMFDDFESVNKLLAPMNTKLLPSVVQAPDLKLKPPPEHLKCIFLENDETIADLKGINPLEENTKPKKEAQGRLNPNIVDVIKNDNFQAYTNERIQLEKPQY
ncbi:hypothetical protein CXB51_017741 [Gossypium anomalum]|uniref:Aspartic peptidase DDI1-type domain-containing protein n=1 Tax=Gossypium anomalum TaxID=47600 RepID=A0A8J5Z7A2_9ROSI|nr:hypothetical protein CXB51_017741 [Gossypium anomalum]